MILADFVSLEDGTGFVHTAPGFGEQDFYACQKAGIDVVCPVDNNGRFTQEIPDYAGRFVKDADKDIIKTLKRDGFVVQHGTCRHRYPFCWRSDTPLIYKAVSTWFVAVEQVKDRVIKANSSISWMPEHIKSGRFGKWLENARDWNISRNRYWGTPIPLWKSDNGDLLAVGSIAELEMLSGKKIVDLHRHYIDEITITKNGQVYKRIPEVFDCWFESGSMPYAQNHYPFENQEVFEKIFPADFIAEGLDQTRGWFYTLTVLSAALFNTPAFKNVVVNGIVLAADGAKMSKRLRNYPDPMDIVKKYGADAIRLYMLHSPAVKAEDLCFSENGVELVLRQVLIPLWNAYSFFVTYARICNWHPSTSSAYQELSQKRYSTFSSIDRWAHSILHKLVQDVEEGMNEYDLSKSVEPLVGFVDQLTNWYIRRSRRRFWEEKPTEDRDQAFATLYEVLLRLSQIAAPFIPFITEEIYQNLRGAHLPESVHLSDFPIYDESKRNERLENAMKLVQQAVSLGHSLRKEHKLKVRQPLPAVHIASSSEHILKLMKEHSQLIAEELNVKNVDFTLNEQQFVMLKAKPNFRVLGKKIGKLMSEAQQAIQLLDYQQLNSLLKGESLTIHLNGQDFTLTTEDVEVERVIREGMVAATEEEISLVLDTQLSEELITEGLAREVVNKINTMRRDLGFLVTDRIFIRLEASHRIKECFDKHGAYIRNEVLALEVDFESCEGSEWDINGELVKIAISKA